MNSVSNENSSDCVRYALIRAQPSLAFWFAFRLASSAAAAIVSIFLLAAGGCTIHQKEIVLPSSSILERDQLVIHSDFYLPKKHRLINELTARRGDMAGQLMIPISDEPINVYVFEKESEFRQFMTKEHPEFPDRRAFFVKNDTTLKVYAFWGDRVGEDLRHEIAHGYLHSVVPNLPLWLDEGLAEFYETTRGTHGLNSAHVYLLNDAFRRGEWQPNLEALEELSDPALMTQLQYAESWLWVHFLLEGEYGEARLLKDQLARLRMSAESEPLSNFVDMEVECRDVKLIEHLKRLASDL